MDNPKYLYVDCTIPPAFVAGVAIRGGLVVSTAVPLFFMLGWSEDFVRNFCANKGWTLEELPTVGSICSHCRLGQLMEVGEDEPWHDAYLICPSCDSTYCKPKVDIA